ncbi:MAG: response regulator [Flavobacteriales bacterium]|nr:response regulator [Flavobacteriales bacterium]
MEKDIWFVDDDLTFRFIIKKFLQDSTCEHRVKYFDDGDLAMLAIINAAKTGVTPKLIFLDLNMKYLEGWQMIDLLNEFDRRLNVIILSSSLNPKDIERAKKEPLVKEFISKPIDKEIIRQKIEQYC